MRAQVFAATAVFVTVAVFSQAASAQTQLNFTNMLDYKIPQELGILIGDARVNIYDYDNGRLGSIVIYNGTINRTGADFLADPTHQIFVKDAATMQRILDADSFVKEFNRQRSLHNIRLEALDFVGQIKLAIGTWITAVISLFISPE